MTDETVVVFDPNVVYEEDIEDAMEKCISLFGPLGRYGDSSGMSGVVFTPKYGKLWYGDLKKEDLNKLNTLQDMLNDEVTFLPE